MKKIMVLGASDFQIPIIKKCRAMGLETFVVDYDKDAVGFSLADHRFILSTTDESAVLDLARKCKINAIITNSDYPVRTLAKVCEEMFLPGPSCHSAKLATNKYQQRKILSDNGFATPKFTDFRSLNDLKSASKNMTYPLIVKPVDSSASRGVSKVSTQEQLLSVCLSTLSYSREKLGIIEEFISGPEFSVEVLVQDNVAHVIAITEKTTGGDDGVFFVETRHIIPADIDLVVQDKIKSAICKLVDVFKINNSALHLELKIFNDEIYIIEVGARLGGDCITTDLVPLSTGVDMVKNVINISLGEKIDINKTTQKHAGIQFVTYLNHESAKVKIEMLKNNEGLVRFLLSDKKFNKLENSLDRWGYFICISNNRNGLLKMLEV